MRKGTKSSFYQVFSPATDVDFGTKRYFVIDGGFLQHKIIWDRGFSFIKICQKNAYFVRSHYGQSVSIIFDGYPDDPEIAGTKTWERRRRFKKQFSAEVIVNPTTIPKVRQ